MELKRLDPFPFLLAPHDETADVHELREVLGGRIFLDAQAVQGLDEGRLVRRALAKRLGN